MPHGHVLQTTLPLFELLNILPQLWIPLSLSAGGQAAGDAASAEGVAAMVSAPATPAAARARAGAGAAAAVSSMATKVEVDQHPDAAQEPPAKKLRVEGGAAAASVGVGASPDGPPKTAAQAASAAAAAAAPVPASKLVARPHMTSAQKAATIGPGCNVLSSGGNAIDPQRQDDLG